MLDLIDKYYELINGEEVMMAPASFGHNGISLNLASILRSYLRGKRCKVRQDVYVQFDDNCRLAPDIVVVCDPSKIRKGQVYGAPDFIAEILSRSTGKRDLTVKKDIYEKFGVKEYWVIDPEKKSVTAYLLRDGKYELDNIYHGLTDEEWEELPDEEKEGQKLSLKLSLYDDLEIDVKEIFEY